MGISNPRIISRDGTTITVAVDPEQKYDHVTSALRTDRAWVEADLSDIVDDTTGAGTQTQKQVTKVTNSFTFTEVSPPYYIGFATTSSDLPLDEQPGGEPAEPPPDPTPAGSIPQPTGLTLDNTTSTTVTLSWVGPANQQTEATGLEFDFQSQFEATANGELPRYGNGRPSMQPINEGDAALNADPKNENGWRSGYVTDAKSRLPAETKSIFVETYDNGINDFQNGMQFHPMRPEPYDKIRHLNKVRWAWGWSVFLVENGQPNSAIVMGQCHDVIEYAPDGTEDAGISPVFAARWNPGGTLSTYGSVDTKAFTTGKAGKGGVGFASTPYGADKRGRWMDVVVIYEFDPVGSAQWPQDGAGPYSGHFEFWVDGVRQSYATGVAFGVNDSQTKGHYPKFGLYSTWALKKGSYENPPPGGWTNTEQQAYYGSMRMATGENATYEMVNPSGKCTAIEVVQETAPGATKVVATLPPSSESYTVSALQSQTQYKYFVRCRYLNQTGTKSGTITVTTA